MKNKSITFVKMSGLGNDFVILDAQKTPLSLEQSAYQKIANRKKGIGCDQIILLEPSQKADLLMRVINADGSEVTICGNALRCVADLVMTEKEKNECVIETKIGLRRCFKDSSDQITVEMGKISFSWDKIPLAEKRKTMPLDKDFGFLKNPYLLSIGNPHAVFFVKDIEAIDLEKYGPCIENDALFLERINVEIVQIVNQSLILMRVWERGAGLTEACGTGACAAAVAAFKAGFVQNKVTIQMPGGNLMIEIDPLNNVMMSGPSTLNFYGTLNLDFLNS